MGEGSKKSDYLEIVAEKVRPLKTHTYELMKAKPGDLVLDVGCGTGIDTLVLSKMVSRTGYVSGIDVDEGSVVEANNTAKAEGVADRVVVVDTDHSTFSVDTSEYNIEWKLRRLRTETHSNGYAGRELYRMFMEAGFDQIKVEIWPVFVTDYRLVRYMKSGLLSREELKAWHDDLEARDEAGVFFATIVQMLVWGVKN